MQSAPAVAALKHELAKMKRAHKKEVEALKQQLAGNSSAKIMSAVEPVATTKQVFIVPRLTISPSIVSTLVAIRCISLNTELILKTIL